MKKAVALILALICVFMLVGCSAEKTDNKVEVYTLSGENDFFSVTNGTVVLNGDEEMFSGGELKVLRQKPFPDTASFSTRFYIVKDGEKRTVLSGSVNDMTGGTVSISGDLGKISGENVITEGKNLSTEDFVNNLYFELRVRDSEGYEKTYEISMDVEKVH
ncbi:MAG: hypothetical protein UHM85_06825 [Acutalibacteraceae bacterium]|nr:hypothetical protein [Acutalibacteraceae bacterium]